MADMYFDVDAAITECPVNLLALIDDTDFKTRETAIAYNAAGMDLVWNFVTSAGAFTQTAVTPTTAGTYDWTHQGDGMYTIEIPASGGASINNDTEGYGWFTGLVTGVLPWRGPVIGFRSAALNDSLCDTNTTGLLAPTVAARTLDVSAGGEAGVDWANVGSPTTAVNLSATNIDVDQVVASVSGAVGSVTGAVGSVTGAVGSVTGAVGSVTGNVGGNVVGSVASVTAGVTLAANAITAAATAADFTTEIQTGLATAAALATVGTNVSAILVDTAEIGAAGAGLTALATQASVNTIDDLLDTEIAAIKAKTDNLPAAPAAVGDIPTAVQNADALLGRNVAGGSSAGRLVKEALYVLRNKTEIGAGTLTVYAVDDTTAAFTAAVTTTAGDPISAIDPA